MMDPRFLSRKAVMEGSMTITNTRTGEILDENTGYDQLLGAYAATLQEAAEAQERAGRLEQTILRRIQANGGTAIPSDTFICELKVSNSYDQTKWIPLKEILNDTEMGRCFESEWVEQKVHPARFKTVQLKAIVNKRGGRAREIFESSLIPGAPILKFERRDEAACPVEKP